MEHFLHEIWVARWPLVHGLTLTTGVSLASIVAGSLLGLLGGIGLTYGRRWLSWPIRLLVDTLRGIPVLVLILAIFYLLALGGINFTAVQSGLLALTVFSAAHMAEILRGALQAIP